MAKYNATALIVDDQDSSISYSSGWQHSPATAEYDLTKSGADEAGMTATFKFTGTGVEVYGSLGSFDVYGRPVSTYQIDGALSTTYQAPIVEPPYFTTHTLFYQSPPLSAGEHTLVITNTNGTKPCVYWLDYIVYTPSNNAAQPPPNGPTSPANQPSSPPTQPQSPSGASNSPTSAPLIQSSPASDASQVLSTPTESITLSSLAVTLSNGQVTTIVTSVAPSDSAVGAASGASTRSKNTAGPIAGGVIGGIVLLIALVGVFLWYRRRKANATADFLDEPRLARPAPNNVTPFGSWPATAAASAFPSEKAARNADTMYSASSQSQGAGPSDGGANMQQYAGFSGPALVSSQVLPYAGASLGRNESTSTGVTSSRPLLPTPSESGSTTGSETPLLPPAQAGFNDQEPSSSRMMIHEDSGARIRPPPSTVDVPPAYTQS